MGSACFRVLARLTDLWYNIETDWIRREGKGGGRMKRKTKWITWVLVLLLSFGIMTPPPAAAAEVYFTSINDTLLPLTAETMPVWSGGLLYVPYTIFDGRYSGTRELGLESSYDRGTNEVSLFKLRQILTFDLDDGTCRNGITEEAIKAKAILRNGQPYVPLNAVCSFFGLERSYLATGRGYLVRVKNDQVVLTDAKFVEAASDLINRRLREYNQSINPSQGAATGQPSAPVEEDTADVRTYLAFRCREGDALREILDTLDGQGLFGLFLLSPQVVEEEQDLIRRMLGSGHSIGLLAEGKNLEETRAELTRGKRLLEQTLYTQATIACVPEEQWDDVEQDGWVLWKETHTLTPTDTVGPNTFAYNTLRRLEGRTRTTYLMMEGNANTNRVLASLLRQLKSNHFLVSIPMETRL